MRIAGQLIDAASGAHLWADHFDGSLEDIFELQDKVAVSVAGVIEPALRAAELQRSVRRRAADLTTYDLDLRARAELVPWDKEGVPRALHLFSQVLERDPHYGPALGFAAICHALLHVGGWTDDPEVSRREGLDLARRALRVAGDDPGILANAAYVLAYFGEDIAAALVLMDRALELNLCFALAWIRSGWLRLWAGQPSTAISHFGDLHPPQSPGDQGAGLYGHRRRPFLPPAIRGSPDDVASVTARETKLGADAQIPCILLCADGATRRGAGNRQTPAKHEFRRDPQRNALA